jgi:cytochrome c oxidase subunit 3
VSATIHAEHFESLATQRHAARLGMWVFLASELLLFSAFFVLFVAYRVHYPQGFAEALHSNTKVLGSINTAVLLLSSAFVASAVHAARAGRRGAAGARVAATIFLGLVFLAIKLTEYGIHLHEGIEPGGAGKYFVEHTTQGLAPFWTLYWIMTGLHAIHVTIGLIVLSVMEVALVRHAASGAAAHRLEVAAIYWHLVDVIWIFLWPLFYLA